MDKRSNALIVVSYHIERSKQKVLDKNNGLLPHARFRLRIYMSISDGTNIVFIGEASVLKSLQKLQCKIILTACISHTVQTSNHHCPSHPFEGLVGQPHPPVTYE